MDMTSTIGIQSAIATLVRALPEGLNVDLRISANGMITKVVIDTRKDEFPSLVIKADATESIKAINEVIDRLPKERNRRGRRPPSAAQIAERIDIVRLSIHDFTRTLSEIDEEHGLKPGTVGGWRTQARNGAYGEAIQREIQGIRSVMKVSA